MALTAFTGNFAANTSTGSQVVDTGTGVEGKAIIFFGHKATAVGDVANAEMFVGCATSSTQEWCAWAEHKDNLATSDASRRYVSDACIVIYNAAGATPTANGIADFTSFGTGADAGKFTINWSDAPAGAYLVHYLFLGGTDITNAKAGTVGYPTATGNFDVTDPGFQADFVLLGGVAGGGDAMNIGSSNVHAAMYLGVGAGANQGATGWKGENARAAWDDYRYQSTARVWASIDNQADDDVATYSGGIANGFRLNFSALPGTGGVTDICYLALKGGQYQVGSFTTQTGTGNFNVNTNFTGKGALFMSTASSAGTHTADTRMSLGAASSSSARGSVALASSEAGEDAQSRSSSTRVYSNISAGAGAPTLNGDIDLVSFNATNMTLNQVDADSSGQTAIFALFGDAAAAGGFAHSWGYII